jgi:hypothetical protein
MSRGQHLNRYLTGVWADSGETCTFQSEGLLHSKPGSPSFLPSTIQSQIPASVCDSVAVYWKVTDTASVKLLDPPPSRNQAWKW